MEKENYIQYKFFEKPTASQLCLQADTALSQNGFVQALVEDIKRRMFQGRQQHKERHPGLDTWSQKMVNSGHPIDSVRPNIISGLKGVLSKQKKCIKKGLPFHRSAKKSSGRRRLKRLTGKSNWFRQKRKDSGPGRLCLATGLK